MANEENVVRLVPRMPPGIVDELREFTRKLKFESTDIPESENDSEDYTDGYADGYNIAEVDAGHGLESILIKYGFGKVERDENE